MHDGLQSPGIVNERALHGLMLLHGCINLQDILADKLIMQQVREGQVSCLKRLAARWARIRAQPRETMTKRMTLNSSMGQLIV